MYEYIGELTSYCGLRMNKIGYKTNKCELYGLDNKCELYGLDLSENEVIDEYNLTIDALPHCG